MLPLSAGTLMASAGTLYRLVPAHFYPCFWYFIAYFCLQCLTAVVFVKQTTCWCHVCLVATSFQNRLKTYLFYRCYDIFWHFSSLAIMFLPSVVLAVSASLKNWWWWWWWWWWCWWWWWWWWWFLCQTELPEDVNIIEHRRLSGQVALTEGGFGVVYRAEHEDWGTVAYKELKATVIKTESRSVLYISCCSNKRTLAFRDSFFTYWSIFSVSVTPESTCSSSQSEIVLLFDQSKILVCSSKTVQVNQCGIEISTGLELEGAQRVHISAKWILYEITGLKDIGITTLTFHGHVTS